MVTCMDDYTELVLKLYMNSTMTLKPQSTYD